MAVNTTAQLIPVKRDWVPSASGNYVGNYPFGTTWQLPAANFISAKMSMTAVYPRPDTDTTTDEYCRNALQSVEYKIPLAVQGGAYPFYYEPITVPTGATIGQTHSDTDYGVLKWTPSASSGSESFHIRVHDQDGNTVDVEWTATINESWVKYVDPVNGSNANDGTRANPYLTLTYAFTQCSGHHLCLRDGTITDWTGGSLLNTGVLGMFGFPGETATIDGASVTGTGVVFWLNHDGHTIQDVRFINCPTTLDNPRWFASLSTNDRLAQTFCTFEDGDGGTLGDDNNSCLFLGAAGTVREYATQSHCSFQNLEAASNGFSSIDVYKTKYLVCQHNTFNVPNVSSSRYVIWIKGGASTYITVRDNHFTAAWGGTNGALISVYLASDGGGVESGYQEFCYNTIISTNTSTTTDNAAIRVAGASQTGLRGPVWSYRNTILGTFVAARTPVELSIFSSENDIVINDCVLVDESKVTLSPQPDHKIAYTWSNDPTNIFRDIENRPSTTSVVLSGLECHQDVAEGVLDGSYLLQGAYRTTYLGRRGSEISP